MSEIQAHATGLTSQYIAQVTGDLERNVKEQERISAEIEALQEQLGALQHDHSVLVSMQEALGGANAVDEADTTAAPTVPRQATAEPRQSTPKKAAATSAKTTASKKGAAKAPSAKTSSAKAPSAKAPSAKASTAKAPTTDTKPTLVNLIRGHLEQQSEPRSATEVSAALTQAHPDRGVKTTVVRTTLEGLVAKSQAQRTKQGSSVFYTATAASETAAAEPQQETVAG
ncbi:BlaI/MecI/CopY family transcriptional regulator [Streptomyces sp. NRRL S-1824]|uniref:BlaI/MecI/CopY family transcriptional regulator n=1 Tax=Streptomyces sp. NRRL S-1824 TaxID=1463889 RepID=UPI0004C523A4|nr:BlaI/MecI/CopY family transcriptional regulator [Streptomyces sp. NRRL S-1824]